MKIGPFKFSVKEHTDQWDSLRRSFEQLKQLAPSLLRHYPDSNPSARKLYNVVICLETGDFILTKAEYQILTPGRELPLHRAENLLSNLKAEALRDSEPPEDTPYS